MLPEEIKQVIANAPRKERKSTTATKLDVGLKRPLIFQFNITIPTEASLLHHIRVDTPPIVRTFYVQHEKELLNFHKYVQTLGLVNAYYALDIYMLPEAAVKHYVWKTKHIFNAEELHLSNTLRRELKHQFVNRLKEHPRSRGTEMC